MDQLRQLSKAKGVVYDDDLEKLWMAAKRKPSNLESFTDALAIALDKLEEEKTEYDNLLFGERHDEQLEDNKTDRDNLVIEQPRPQSDGSIRDGDTTFRRTIETPEITSKAYVPPITPYHWSRKKEWFKQKETIRESSPSVQKAFCLKRRIRGNQFVYYIDQFQEEEGWEDVELNLSSEPGEKQYDGLDFTDVIDKSEREIEEAFQTKGRVSYPINLDRYPELKMGDGLTSIGCDPARMGGDSTCILIRQGDAVCDIQRFTYQDTMTSTGFLVQAISEWKPDSVQIELTGGLGSGIYDRLMELGLDEVTNICGIETQSQKVRYERLMCFNVRTEMFFLLKERFAEGRISVPPSDEGLAEEIVAIKFKPLSDGRVIIIENREIRKILGRSPDVAVSCALAFYPQTETGIW